MSESMVTIPLEEYKKLLLAFEKREELMQVKYTTCGPYYEYFGKDEKLITMEKILNERLYVLQTINSLVNNRGFCKKKIAKILITL